MKLNFKSKVPAIICVSLFIFSQSSKILAQDNSNVKEPPIPVYIICPYHEDSLRAAYEGSMQGGNFGYVYSIKKYDTLQQQIQKSSAESNAHFIWLCSLVALLGIMNIVLLFSTARIRKELTQMKRFEHYQKLLTSGSSTLSQPSPKIQEAVFNQEPTRLRTRVRIHKPRIRKPRSRTQK